MNMMKTHRIRNLDGFSFSEAANYALSCSLNSLNLNDNQIEEKQKKQINDGIDVNNLIMSQDIIEGFWVESELNKIILNYINKDKYKIINDRIKKMNKKNIEMKIKYTVLVIYSN